MLMALLFVLFDAPKDCPPQQRFEAELRLRTSKVDLVSEAKSDTKLTISIKKVKGRFVGTSSMHGAREFKGGNCEAVVTAMALATALLLDPEARTSPVTAEEIAAAPAPVEPKPAPPEPAPPEPAPVRAPEPEPVKPEPAARVVAPAPAPLRAAAPSPWTVTLLAGGGLSTAVSGGVEPGVSLSLSLRRGFVAGQVTPLFLFGRTVSSAAGTAVYRSGGARLDLGAAVDLGSVLELRPAAQLTVLAVPISAPLAEEPRPDTSWLIAPGAALQLLVKLGAWRLSLDGGAGFNVRRERWVISNLGLVFAAPVAFGYAALSVGRTIP